MQVKKNMLFRLFVKIFLILLLSYLLTLRFLRVDLTTEKRYTLSDYTIETLKKLEDKTYIKVYLTGEGLPATLKAYRRRIEEELEEFKIYAKNTLIYEFVDPAESKDKEMRFSFYKSLMDKGLIPIETQEISDDGKSSQKMVFPGAVVSCAGKETIINLLKTNGNLPPESEESVNASSESLEYELINAIAKVTRKQKDAIAFIEGQGECNEYEVMDISSKLSEYYTVKTGKINGKIGILDDFKAVIIARPLLPFSEQDKFVIDQYIMNGGNLLYLAEGTYTPQDSLLKNGSTLSLSHDLNMDDLLFTYGVRINHDLLLDKFSAPIGIAQSNPDGKPTIKFYPWYYFPVLVSDNKHVISKYLNYIRTEYVSTLDIIGKRPEVKKTILLKSSPETRLEPIPARINLQMAQQMPPDEYMRGGQKNIAVLLEGKFTSAFKNRNPENYFPQIDKTRIRDKSKHARIIVVADGDLIRNQVSRDGRPYPIGFDRFTRKKFKGNAEFILNAVNYLCDDDGLMSVRARELRMRLLNRKKITLHRTRIQLLNTLLPLCLVALFGFFVYIARRKKYAPKTPDSFSASAPEQSSQ